MKINEVIREKRKELFLTQEQIAERLGVSTPAVNKWEKGITYPDITLLPALARLLKIDLNTLMCFHENLTDMEIENFVNEVDIVVQEQGYKKGFQMAMDKIHEYPTCDNLLYSVVLYLQGALLLYNVSETEDYKDVFKKIYGYLYENEVQEIRDTAMGMLISYALQDNEFSKAEEMIKTLPCSSLDREEQLAILYQKQKKYSEAEKIWEHRILNGVTEIQVALVNMVEKALVEQEYEKAEFFADVYEKLICQFYFPEWMRYSAHLEIALERKDKERCLFLLRKMLPAMKKEWRAQQCPLYCDADTSDTTFLTGKLSEVICEELENKEEYLFLHDCTEFQELMAKIRN